MATVIASLTHGLFRNILRNLQIFEEFFKLVYLLSSFEIDVCCLAQATISWDSSVIYICEKRCVFGECSIVGMSGEAQSTINHICSNIFDTYWLGDVGWSAYFTRYLKSCVRVFHLLVHSSYFFSNSVHFNFIFYYVLQ